MGLITRPRFGAAAILTICLLAFLGVNAGFTVWLLNSNDHKWCATLNLLYAQKPPPGNPAKNPSRAFDQDLHARFAQLRDDLGCA